MRTTFLVFIAIFIAGMYGWVMNIVAICSTGSFDTWSGMLIARVVGVFLAPLGAVLGYF